MSFLAKLDRARTKNNSLLCVGLDPRADRIPARFHGSPTMLSDFCREVISATADQACVYKPNLAFFEASGSAGIAQLEQVMEIIPDDIPVILDAKRGDIGSTAQMYAHFLFEHLGGDAATVSPYLGGDTLEPFLAHEGKCIFVLCVTSNPGAAELQFVAGDSPMLYERVIEICKRLGDQGEIGLVTGATHVEQLKQIRTAYPDGPLLVPGLGVQGGDTKMAVRAATANGTLPAVFNVSRGISYPEGDGDFGELVRAKAIEYRQAINDALAG